MSQRLTSRVCQVAAPLGFRTYVANIGVKDTTDDLVIIVADAPCSAAGVWTTSRFAGPSVALSRRNIVGGEAQVLLTLSKNANVANGPSGVDDAEEVARIVAEGLGVSAEHVLLASTGVIGRRYPMDRIRRGLVSVRPDVLQPADLAAAARGIMTTDTVPKTASAAAGAATVAGIAKGVGMIEPNMATLITYCLTDALVDPGDLALIWQRVTEKTWNRVSVDTDTSTSDTAVVLASGLAGPVELAVLESALTEVCTSLVRQVARDGEGATKLITVEVTGARDEAQAVRVAKSVVNSPLVKTAVHGADPNWGRVAMAVGKTPDCDDVDPDAVVIGFGGVHAYPGPTDLAALTAAMTADEVPITVGLGIGAGQALVWGCDLSDGYIRINADYTT